MTDVTVADQRMLQLGTGWFPERRGGAENVYYNLFRELRCNRFDVRGIVPGTQQAERETLGRVRTFVERDRSLISRGMAIRSTCARLLESPFHIIGAHFALYALPILDKIRRTPFIVHFHGPWAMESLMEGGGTLAARCKKAIETTVYGRADRIIVLSDAFGQILQQHYGIAASTIRRIPGGVDCARFDIALQRDAARDALGWSRDRPVVLAVRRLVRRMGLDNLIEAMRLLPCAHKDAVLYIVGTGPERDALEQQVCSAGLDNSVRFVGPMSDADLPLAYRAADLTIVPSAALEGFGLIAVESLAAGTPVLVTPVGGLTEVVSGLSERLVLPGKNPAAIALGLAAALGSASSLPDAETCARYAKSRFDWTGIGTQTAAVYRELL